MQKAIHRRMSRLLFLLNFAIICIYSLRFGDKYSIQHSFRASKSNCQINIFPFSPQQSARSQLAQYPLIWCKQDGFNQPKKMQITQSVGRALVQSLLIWATAGISPATAFVPPPPIWISGLGWQTALQEVPPPPEEGNCFDCLGVVNGLLAECPGTPTCVSSQDDRPYPFLEPWQYDMSQPNAMKKLVAKIQFYPNAKIVKQTEDYLRVELTDKLTGAIDDAEWYFTPNDSIIQFRSARRGSVKTDFAQNRKRMEDIRISLGFEKVPVLRNRKRALVFFESPLDSFGPATIRDMTPEEMDQMDMYRGDIDPLAPEWQAPSKQMRALKDILNAEIDDRTRSK